MSYSPSNLKWLAFNRIIQHLPAAAAQDGYDGELPVHLADEMKEIARFMEEIVGFYVVTELKITSNFQDDDDESLPALISDGVMEETIQITKAFTDNCNIYWVIGQLSPASMEMARVCWSFRLQGSSGLNGQMVITGRPLVPVDCGDSICNTLSFDMRGNLVWCHTSKGETTMLEATRRSTMPKRD